MKKLYFYVTLIVFSFFLWTHNGSLLQTFRWYSSYTERSLVTKFLRHHIKVFYNITMWIYFEKWTCLCSETFCQDCCRSNIFCFVAFGSCLILHDQDIFYYNLSVQCRKSILASSILANGTAFLSESLNLCVHRCLCRDSYTSPLPWPRSSHWNGICTEENMARISLRCVVAVSLVTTTFSVSPRFNDVECNHLHSLAITGCTYGEASS